MKTIRDTFAEKLANEDFTSVNREQTMTALSGNTTIEIMGASFVADEPCLFGTLNEEYVKREEEWYNSMSLNVNDIPGGPPAVWKAVADKDGFINSNYGWCIYSYQNFLRAAYDPTPYTNANSAQCQYTAVYNELRENPASRRAVMIYNRPQMWHDYNHNGRSDFMCTNDVQYMIRDGLLHAVVNMRSNDAVFGFKNDKAWQQHVLEKLAADLKVTPGFLHWRAGSLHVYARHYYLVHHYLQTGRTTITPAEYKAFYPKSEFLPA